MEDNLEDLMGHIDYFYQIIPSAYDGDVKFTVYLKNKIWKIENSRNPDLFESQDHKEALQYLVDRKVDLSILHTLVYGNVCTEGVLRRMQLKKVTELVGLAAIDKQEEGWANFGAGLKDIIEKTLDSKEKTCLTLVEDE